jgi:hypothetical protein
MTLRDEMRLIAVYDSETDARSAVRTLEHSGIAVAQVRIGDDRDRLSSVKGEMRGEVARTVAGPGNVGPFTKEMSRGSLIGLVIGGMIGAVLGLPLAFVGLGELSTAASASLAIGAGIVVGATAGWVFFGAFAAKRPDEPLAAETGTTVALPLSDQAKDVLVATNARRIDVVDPGGRPVTSVAEREEPIARDIARHMRTEERHG